jgi:hypothetical protein
VGVEKAIKCGSTNAFAMRIRPLVLFLGLAAAACVRPTSTPVLGPLPFATDSGRVERVAEGVWYRFLYAPSGPWAIHVLDVDLARCNRLVALKDGTRGPTDAAGRTKTTRLLAELARRTTDGRVVGGVNADFFSLANGTPVGLLVVDGRRLTAPGTEAAFGIDSAGTARVVASADLAAFRPREAVGGHPVLLRDSAVVVDVDTSGNAGFRGRNPRTAAGVAARGRRVLLVVIDGRQKAYSDGASLRETANVLLALGARDALNLDGGGSSAMVLARPAAPPAVSSLVVASRPSDAPGERAVGDAVAVVNTCMN